MTLENLVFAATIFAVVGIIAGWRWWIHGPAIAFACAAIGFNEFQKSDMITALLKMSFGLTAWAAAHFVNVQIFRTEIDEQNRFAEFTKASIVALGFTLGAVLVVQTQEAIHAFAGFILIAGAIRSCLRIHDIHRFRQI